MEDYLRNLTDTLGVFSGKKKLVLFMFIGVFQTELTNRSQRTAKGRPYEC